MYYVLFLEATLGQSFLCKYSSMYVDTTSKYILHIPASFYLEVSPFCG